MVIFRLPLIGATALLLLGGCASRGGSPAAGVGEPEYSGIQTRSIRAAPAAQAAANESRPLSELNTPDAIAAREALARSGVAPVAPPTATAPQYSTPAAPQMASSTANPHQKIESLQKGAKVRVRSTAVLQARPSAGGDSIPLPAGTIVELGPQVYNAGGYWWYVTAGKDSGWLLQSDIVP